MPPEGGLVKVVLDTPNDLNVLAGPTAVAFGRISADNGNLYIATTGGFLESTRRNWTVGRRLSRIDIEGWA